MPVPKRVVEVGADEAEEILHEQDRVVGYESLALAEAIKKELKKRGLRTHVVADVGPVVHVRTHLEEREMRRLGIEPGKRYTRYGLVRVRSHQRRR